jgi:hypothetical protein
VNRDQRRMIKKGKWPFRNGTLGQMTAAMDAMNNMDEAERIRIIVELDIEAAKRLFPMISDEAVLPMLHKVRYETASASDELRHESRAWLEQNGLHRVHGLPWPPKGELDK